MVAGGAVAVGTGAGGAVAVGTGAAVSVAVAVAVTNKLTRFFVTTKLHSLSQEVDEREWHQGLFVPWCQKKIEIR